MAGDRPLLERRRVRALSDDILARADARIALARAVLHRSIDVLCDRERVRTMHQVAAARAAIAAAHFAAMADCCPSVLARRIRAYLATPPTGPR